MTQGNNKTQTTSSSPTGNQMRVCIIVGLFMQMIMDRGVYGFSAPSHTRSSTVSSRSSIAKTTTNRSTSLAATLSFEGDSRASMNWNAPPESVQEWLQSSDSDFHLLGTRDAKQQPSASNAPALWDCRQPRIDFMGVELVPIFVSQIRRIPPSTATVSIVRARTEIAGNNRRSTNANKVVASVLEKSKFVGKSHIRARRGPSSSSSTPTTIVSVDLDLTLQVPLPPFVLLPPGFNSIGSAIVRQNGKSRTKELLTTLQRAYQQWAAEQKTKQSIEEKEENETTISTTQATTKPEQ